jgi:hypothetical protein
MNTYTGSGGAEMKRSTLIITAAAALGLLAFAQTGFAQSPPANSQADPASQPTDPSLSAAGQQQEVPTETAPCTSQPAASDPSTPAGAPSSDDARTSTAAVNPSGATSNRLAAVTPSGMTTQEACTGFQSVMECATTMHASQNLNLSFADLKSKMTGGQKLGAAIHDLKPEANANDEVTRAEQQARSDILTPRG